MTYKKWTVRRPELVRYMRAVQRNRCALCGNKFGSAEPTVEHVIPKSQGGKRRGNLVLTHRGCNERRGAANPTGCLLITLEAVNIGLGLTA